VYSDFYEIPLPALRFEKTEEIDYDKKWKWHWREERRIPNRHTEEEWRQKNDYAHQINGKDLSIECQKDWHSRNERRFQKREKRHAVTKCQKQVLSRTTRRKTM
jgi:hypothetical protein